MNEVQFREQIAAVGVGKRLPGALYIHCSAIDQLGDQLSRFLCNISSALELDNLWNVLKLDQSGFKVSFLHYPNFEDDAYPSLKTSNAVDLKLKKLETRDYTNNSNPPILHRKELLVGVDHPLYEDFCLITKEGEEAGLYDDTTRIGNKRSWEALIARKGYALVDGRLFRNASFSDEISRERTAITRYELSSPFQALGKVGFLEGNFSVLDYGCGLRDDMQILQGQGLDVIGWDPNHFPEGEVAPRDIVNLGFVINVIEDRAERAEALRLAWSNAKKLLVVSAMIATERQIEKFTPYRDGVITSRNTFQKYYSQQDLREYIAETLECSPIAAGTGVFLVFRDFELEARYLEKKYTRRESWSRAKGVRRTAEQRLNELIEANLEAMEGYWLKALQLGRFPESSEFDGLDELVEVFGSRKKLERTAMQHFGDEVFLAAEKSRKEDLALVEALGRFRGRQTFKRMPDYLKRDVRHFFSRYRDLKEAADGLMESLTKTDQIQSAVVEFTESGNPCFYDGRGLHIHKAFVTELPVLLRAYIGCALQLYGDLEPIDLIKIHVESGKLSLMGYDNFDSSPLPLLRERIKVSLWNLRVDYFDYVDEFVPTPLYQKSNFIDESFADYEKQRSFDEKLELYGFSPEHPSFGPRRAELDRQLREAGLEIRGYRYFNV